ncbi:noggin-1 [Galendromus occidentalis]|uniref:Noggin-1 n=1 Tax=Galendromus occidentalis TaxID=34638 RepID=A0AAJ6QWD8_9ACAR|nr:noggin-1 [Galendromus occidentalis]
MLPRKRWSHLSCPNCGITTFFLCIQFSILLAGVLHTETVAGDLSPDLKEKAKYLVEKLRSDNETEDIPPPPAERYKKPEIDTAALLKELGEDILPKYMSISNPNITQRTPSVEHKIRQKSGPRHKTLKDLLGGRVDDLPKNNPEFRRLLKKFLRNHSQCKVSRYWADMGDRYFPRYVRKGYCAHTNSSCSIPPGLTCLPEKRKELKLMYWACHISRFSKRTRVGSDEGDDDFDMENMRCRWRKVVYSVLDECTCRCKPSSSESVDLDE